jgi:hypothetical protein
VTVTFQDAGRTSFLVSGLTIFFLWRCVTVRGTGTTTDSGILVNIFETELVKKGFVSCSYSKISHYEIKCFVFYMKKMNNYESHLPLKGEDLHLLYKKHCFLG